MSEKYYDSGGDVELSDNQFMMLKKAVDKRGSAKLTLTLARGFYSDKAAAKNGLKSLKGKGIVEYHSEGVWRITNLPQELYDEWVD